MRQKEYVETPWGVTLTKEYAIKRGDIEDYENSGEHEIIFASNYAEDIADELTACDSDVYVEEYWTLNGEFCEGSNYDTKEHFIALWR